MKPKLGNTMIAIASKIQRNQFVQDFGVSWVGGREGVFKQTPRSIPVP